MFSFRNIDALFNLNSFQCIQFGFSVFTCHTRFYFGSQVSLFDGMERWNGTMEWNGGMELSDSVMNETVMRESTCTDASSFSSMT